MCIKQNPILHIPENKWIIKINVYLKAIKAVTALAATLVPLVPESVCEESKSAHASTALWSSGWKMAPQQTWGKKMEQLKQVPLFFMNKVTYQWM